MRWINAMIPWLIMGCTPQQVTHSPSLDINRLNQAKHHSVLPIPEPEPANLPLARLGWQLFQDPRLSSNNAISCATCHELHHYGAQSSMVSTGVNGLGERNSPTVFNSSLNPMQFWDGRAFNLHTQIDGPVHNPVEMDSNWPDIVSKLQQDSELKSQFQRLYPDGITKANIKHAIDYFESQLLTPNSRFDQFLKGEIRLSSDELQGWQQFQDIGCINCHQGVNLGGNLYQSFGLTHRIDAKSNDSGLYSVSKDPRDNHVFRVPSLRNIAETAPYFHDGSIAGLSDAVELMAISQLGVTLTSDQRHNLTQFLHTLTAPKPQILEELQ